MTTLESFVTEELIRHACSLIHEEAPGDIEHCKAELYVWLSALPDAGRVAVQRMIQDEVLSITFDKDDMPIIWLQTGQPYAFCEIQACDLPTIGHLAEQGGLDGYAAWAALQHDSEPVPPLMSSAYLEAASIMKGV